MWLPMNKSMSFDLKWELFKKRILRMSAILLWGASLIFSYLGFTSQSSGGWFWSGIAVIFSFSITVLELWFNGEDKTSLFQPTKTIGEWIMVLGGILSYGYDIWTNILGFCVLMLGIPKPDLAKIDWSLLVIPVIGGIALAVLPEPMFITSMKSHKKEAISTYPISKQVVNSIKG